MTSSSKHAAQKGKVSGAEQVSRGKFAGSCPWQVARQIGIGTVQKPCSQKVRLVQGGHAREVFLAVACFREGIQILRIQEVPHRLMGNVRALDLYSGTEQGAPRANFFPGRPDGIAGVVVGALSNQACLRLCDLKFSAQAGALHCSTHRLCAIGRDFWLGEALIREDRAAMWLIVLCR